MKWLDKIPTAPLIIIALVLAVMPPQEPHLWQKLNWLVAGKLVKPLDIFDLFMHGTPLVLVLLKLARGATRR